MSPATDTACVYSAEVMHQRFTTAQYRFRYRIFSLLLDIDGIGEAAASTRLLSLNRFNLLSFHAADHLPAGETDLRVWAERVLAGEGIDGSGLKIRLLCFPRILGWVFNPLSLWYCETPEGGPVAVIADGALSMAWTIIDLAEGDRLMLVASQTGSRRPFTDRQLLLQVLRVPLQTLKVITAIHWQALKIWAQGARFHRKPAPPVEEVS